MNPGPERSLVSGSDFRASDLFLFFFLLFFCSVFFLHFRSGESGGAGEEEDPADHNYRFSSLLCRGVACAAGERFDWSRGGSVDEQAGAPGPGHLP